MKKSLCRMAVATVILLLALGLAGVTPAYAGGTITVSTTSDVVDGSISNLSMLQAGPGADGKISLREAIQAANNTASSAGSPNVINLPAGDYRLTGGQLTVSPKVGAGVVNLASQIQGAASATTIIEHDTSTADARIFEVDPDLAGNVVFSVAHVTVAHGRNGAGGGAVLSGWTGDQTTFSDVIFADNLVPGTQTNTPGGAIVNSGGNLTVVDCVFIQNRVGNGTLGSSGGAIYFNAPANRPGTLTVRGSTFDSNVATASAAGQGGGAIRAFGAGGVFNISTSSFIGNQVLSGNASGGGAIYAPSGNLTLSQNVFSGNRVMSTGPGQDAGGAVYSSSMLTAQFNRFFGNVSAAPAFANTIFYNGSGTANVNDNWWGQNSGPAAQDLVGAAAARWLQLQLVASPSSIYPGQTASLSGDILGVSTGGMTAAANLNGLPAFPVPPTSIFGGAQLGSLSNAGQQLINGRASATYTAGSAAGIGGASLTVDNQTVAASIIVLAPDLTATLDDDTGHAGTAGTAWTWSLKVANAGNAAGSFLDGQVILVDDLPAGNIGYSLVPVSNLTGITGSGSVNCAITSGTLTCSASGGQVTLAPGGGFRVGLTAMPGAPGSYVNPRAYGQCRVDPGSVIAETNRTNNDCVDTVLVSRAPSSIVLTSSLNPAVYGQTVTFVVNVSGYVAPTGPVTIAIDGTSAGSLALDAAGQASYSTSVLGAGTHAVSATYAGDANLTGSVSSPLNQNVDRAPATIGLSNLSQTYDGTAKNVTASTNPSGLVVITTYSGTGGTTYGPSQTPPTGAGSYAVQATLDEANYQAPDVTGTLVVAKATASISLSGLSQTYDGTPRGATATTTPTGLGGATITYGGSTTAPTDAGTYPVVASLINPNYQAPEATGTLVIAKAAATIGLSNLSQTYDGTSKGVTATTAPLGLTVVMTYTGTGGTTYGPSQTPPTGAGSYAVEAGLSEGNYEAPDATGTLVIAKAAATVTLGDLSQIYDGTPKSASATTTPAGLSGVTITYDGSTTAPIGADSYAVVARLNNSNYQAPNATGTLVVAKAMASIGLSGLSQTYDGTPRSAGATTIPAGLSGVAVTYDGSTTAPTDAGRYVVVARLSNSNYQAPDATGTLVVEKAAVTLTLDDLSQTYDGTAKSATASTTPGGLSGVTITYDGATTAPTHAGSYAVVASLNNTNYQAPDAIGTLVIAKAAATIGLSNLSQTYDGSAKSATATTAPLGLTVVMTYTGTSGTTYGPSQTAPVNAGSYAVEAALSEGNYRAPHATGTLVIAKAAATITLSDLSRIFDGTPKSASATTTPAGLNDVTITYDGSATAPTDAGSYNVVASLNNANYQAPDATGTLVIGTATASIELNNLSHTYDGTPKSATATTAPPGLAVIITYTGTDGTTYGPSQSAPTGAGSYAVMAALSEGNYEAPDATGTLVIAKAAATITLGDLSQIFDGTAKSVTASTSPAGLSGVAIAYDGSTTAPTDAGSYAVVARLSNPNYQAPDATGTLMVAKAAATLSLGDLSQTFDGGPKSVTASTNPLGLSVVITYTGTGGTTYGPSQTAPTGAGSYDVLATTDDTNHQAADEAGILVVSRAASTAVLSASPNPSFFGDTVTVSATVTISTPLRVATLVPDALTGQFVGPTGVVTFTVDAYPPEKRTLDGQGLVISTTTGLAIGDHSVTAYYGGDANFIPSSSNTLRLTVQKRPIVYTYLPLVSANYVVAPDLVVDRLTATAGGLQVVIRNQGNAPVASEFWVDLYVNPNPAPNAVNQTWPSLSGQGLVWGVTSAALPQLVPGGTLTLNLGDSYQWPSISEVNWPLPTGTLLYAQVDSADPASTYGTALESHEITGAAYNNILGPVRLAEPLNPPATILGGAGAAQPRADQLPSRH